MSELLLIVAVRVAGGCHLVTLGCACLTPIPRGWDENLAKLPRVHRRFAIAQNAFIGATIGYLGVVSICLAPTLVAGTPAARALCTATALWWGGRLWTLGWLGVWSELRGRALRAGFALLHVECAALGLGYGWLALRGHT